jgi:hypothetical protein
MIKKKLGDLRDRCGTNHDDEQKGVGNRCCLAGTERMKICGFGLLRYIPRTRLHMATG